MALIPVTILTGFLGSGKTTLLKHILTEQHGKKIAVIENEFGEENIDNDILVQDHQENIVQMSNGCICCTIRGDLVEASMRSGKSVKTKKSALIGSSLKPQGLPIQGLSHRPSLWMMMLRITMS